MHQTLRRISGRKLKQQVLQLLQKEDFAESLDRISRLPLRQVVNPLFAFLYHRDALVKWRAVSAMGAVVSKIAESDMESARVIMRRLLWNLNDESGGIGWGSPEAMGEIMAENKTLAEEYAGILISYIDVNGNYIEYAPLQRGVVWAIGRLAHAFPKLVKDAALLLDPFFMSDDPFLRGYSIWTAGALKTDRLKPYIDKLVNDDQQIMIYRQGNMANYTIKDLIREYLSDMKTLPRQK